MNLDSFLGGLHTLYAEKDGQVEQVLIKPGTQVETGDLMMVIA